MRRAAIILSVTVSLALALAASAGASTPLSGWWPLYESNGTVAHDSSGNRNNGTVSGGAQWTGGYFGSGLSFDGAHAEVDIPNAPSLEPSSAITVSAYVKASGSPGNWKYIIAKGALNCIAASYGLYTGANGGLVFYVSQNDAVSYSLSPDAGTGLWDGNWHFVVGTYDGSAVHLYVNGVEVGSGTPASGPIGYGLPTSSDLFIGHYDGACPAGGDNFAGSIDEPTVWNRALTSSQVLTQYRVLAALHGFISRLPSFPGS